MLFKLQIITVSCTSFLALSHVNKNNARIFSTFNSQIQNYISVRNNILINVGYRGSILAYILSYSV